MSGIPREKYFKRPRRIPEGWLLDEIRRLANGANDLSSVSALKNYPSLYNAGCNRYRSWYAALKAAGVNPDKYRRIAAEGSWTETRIVSEIRKLQSSGEDLSYTAVQKAYPDLVAAATRRYTSWANGVAAAGLNYESCRRQHPPGYWTKGRVMSEIKQRLEAGKDMSRVLVGKDSPSLLRYARIFYGGWFEALDAAGIESGRYRRFVPAGFWSRERITGTIAEMYRSGEDIRPSALSRTHPSLMSAAKRRFKRTEDMYFEAGLKPSEIGMLRKWTKDSVVSVLRELQSSGEDIKPYKLNKGGYSGLINAGLREYGSLESMYKAAGIELRSAGYRKRRSKKYTKEQAISYLRELNEKGEDTSPKALEKNHYGLYYAIRKLFGSSWDFYEASGLAPLDYMTVRKHGFWTKTSVVEEIQRLKRSGEDLHLNKIRNNHLAVVRGAYRTFGSWHTACEAAGVQPADYRIHFARGYYTDEKIAHMIAQLRQSGADLSDPGARKAAPKLYAAALGRYGTWYDALEAAGINAEEYRRQVIKGYWTEHRILDMVKSLGASGEDLSYTHIESEKGDLLSAAMKRFGSWENAVKKAGFDYDSFRKQHKQYTKVELLEFLRSLRARGAALDWTSVKKIDESKAMVINRLFGTYRKAIEELGLDYETVRRHRDSLRESYKGKVFEIYAREAFEILGRNLDYHHVFKFQKERCHPDYYDPITGLWIDAKLDSRSWGIEETVAKYLKYTSRLQIFYLKGKRRLWGDESVEFVPISDFYQALIDRGAGDLVQDFEKLKKGVLRPEFQTELDRFISRKLSVKT